MSKKYPSLIDYIRSQTGTYSTPFVVDRLGLESFIDLGRVSYAITNSKQYSGVLPAKIIEDGSMRSRSKWNRYKTTGGFVVANHEVTLNKYLDDFKAFGITSSEIRRVYLTGGLAPYILRKYLSGQHPDQVKSLTGFLSSPRVLLDKIESDVLDTELPNEIRGLGSAIYKKVSRSTPAQIARLNMARFGIGMFAFENVTADRGVGALRHSGRLLEGLKNYSTEKALQEFCIVDSNKKVWTQEATFATSYLYPMEVPEISDVLVVATIGGSRQIGYNN